MSMTPKPILSVLMPVYNERETLLTAIDRLELADLGVPIELIVVDDGSRDGSTELLRHRAEGTAWISPVFHERNQGKGRAIRTALEHATGRFACIYDADLEYDPADMARLLEPLVTNRTEVVYGIRAFGGHAAHSYWYVLGNRGITTIANVLFNCYLRDIMTCYKMMPLELFRSLDIRSSGFDLEAEITGKLLAGGYRIYEVPISYRARTREEGKKLEVSDAWGVLLSLAKLRYRNRRRASRPLPRTTGRPTEPDHVDRGAGLPT
jgi:dolichol-phosphate hexosyltransferase